MPEWLAGTAPWLTLAAILLFVLGLVMTLPHRDRSGEGVERLIPFGRVFFGMPLAFFGLQHFAFLNEVKGVVPSYLPGHVFWTCFVGAALIASCLSLIMNILANWAALLTGIMLFLFVLMIYLPFLAAHPHSRDTFVGLGRDLSLSGGAFALAGTLGIGRGLARRPVQWLIGVGRWFFAVPMVFYGVQHFFHPDFAPGVPYPVVMPAWVPVHLLWTYATGAALVAGGLCVLANVQARAAAAWIGLVFLVLTVCIYLPREIIHPSIAISGELDDLVDTLVESGAALFVAGAMVRKAVRAPVVVMSAAGEQSVSG